MGTRSRSATVVAVIGTSGWMWSKRLVVLASVVVLAAAPLAGCGDNDGETTTTATTANTATTAPTTSQSGQPTDEQISGIWRGTSASDDQPERTISTFTVDFSQDGNTLNGPITMINGCISEGTVSGTLSGQTIEFGLIENTGIEFTGTVSGDSMSGSWKTQPPCTPDNDTGTWQATR